MGYEVGLRKEKGEVISYWLKDSALLLELTTDLMEDISTIRAYNGGRFYRWKETGKKQGIWVVTEGQTYDFNDDPNQSRTNFYVRDILSQTKKEEVVK